MKGERTGRENVEKRGWGELGRLGQNSEERKKSVLISTIDVSRSELMFHRAGLVPRQ